MSYPDDKKVFDTNAAEYADATVKDVDVRSSTSDLEAQDIDIKKLIRKM